MISIQINIEVKDDGKLNFTIARIAATGNDNKWEYGLRYASPNKPGQYNYMVHDQDYDQRLQHAVGKSFSIKSSGCQAREIQDAVQNILKAELKKVKSLAQMAEEALVNNQTNPTLFGHTHREATPTDESLLKIPKGSPTTPRKY